MNASHIHESRCASLLRVAEMGRADELTISGGVPGLSRVPGIVLMEEAGAAVAKAITDRWRPDQLGGPCLVLCGPGNNGGDGFVIARLLARAGWPVELALLGEISSLKGDAAEMAARWTSMETSVGANRGGSTVIPLVTGSVDELVNRAGMVVDALFGAGLTRSLDGAAGEAVVAANNLADAPRIAVDIPSGVHGDNGQILLDGGGGGCAFDADLTVTFFLGKPGHLLMPGRVLCGEVVVADIGINEQVLAEINPPIFSNGPALWGDCYPWPKIDGHKYSRGHAVVVSGGIATTGAARMAARAALRVGAGLVTIACPPDALAVVAGQSMAVMSTAFSGSDGLSEILADKRKNAVLVGPGNGVSGAVGEATRQNVLAALSAGCRCVLDADALTIFADNPAQLFAALGQATDVVLTPHEGEFKRLFGDIAPPDAGEVESKITQALSAATLSGSVVLYKGPDTVIAAPDGRAAINSNAPPELATAGSGDVLAGLITGLLAQGMPPFEAACAGAWLHGAAASRFGAGMIAEDLPEILPTILSDLKADNRVGSPR